METLYFLTEICYKQMLFGSFFNVSPNVQVTRHCYCLFILFAMQFLPSFLSFLISARCFFFFTHHITQTSLVLALSVIVKEIMVWLNNGKKNDCNLLSFGFVFYVESHFTFYTLMMCNQHTLIALLLKSYEQHFLPQQPSFMR